MTSFSIGGFGPASLVGKLTLNKGEALPPGASWVTYNGDYVLYNGQRVYYIGV